jgi:hypothetical protein
LSPILTADYFEFGNSISNNLSREGCGVEMGDAVLELGNAAPKWAVIRNLSDPVINGNLREDTSALNPRLHCKRCGPYGIMKPMDIGRA